MSTETIKHIEFSKENEIYIKVLITSDFESNLFLKLKEFNAFVITRSKILNLILLLKIFL